MAVPPLPPLWEQIIQHGRGLQPKSHRNRRVQSHLCALRIAVSCSDTFRVITADSRTCVKSNKQKLVKLTMTGALAVTPTCRISTLTKLSSMLSVFACFSPFTVYCNTSHLYFTLLLTILLSILCFIQLTLCLFSVFSFHTVVSADWLERSHVAHNKNDKTLMKQESKAMLYLATALLWAKC